MLLSGWIPAWWTLLDIHRAHLFMMRRSVVFGKVISAITFTMPPVNIELALVDAVSDPEEAHIHALRPLLFDCSCKDAHITLIIHFDCVGGCGEPISIKAVWIDTHDRQLLNTATISASVADDITLVVIEHMTWTAPFQGGGGSVLKASFRLVDGFTGVSQLSDGMTLGR